jgi:hypothetical protein
MSDVVQEKRLMWCGMASVPKKHEVIVVRVFITPGASQAIPFQAALSYLKTNKPYRVEYLTVDMLKNSSYKYKPIDLIRWLLASNIHIIATHPNQGQQHWCRTLRWNMVELMSEMSKLKYHNGFPNGVRLKCPMFTQDKDVYLKALPHLTNETLCIPLDDTSIEHRQVEIHR